LRQRVIADCGNYKHESNSGCRKLNGSVASCQIFPSDFAFPLIIWFQESYPGENERVHSTAFRRNDRTCLMPERRPNIEVNPAIKSEPFDLFLILGDRPGWHRFSIKPKSSLHSQRLVEARDLNAKKDGTRRADTSWCPNSCSTCSFSQPILRLLHLVSSFRLPTSRCAA